MAGGRVWPADRVSAQTRRNARKSTLNLKTESNVKTKTNFVATGLLLANLANGFGQAAAIHQFDGIALLSDQTISLGLTGGVSSLFRSYFDIYVLETSTNLLDWTPQPTLLRTNSSTNALIYLDREATNSDKRFYRTFTNILITPFAKPTGPYPVARVSRLMTDPSRTNRYRISTNGSFTWTGSFMVTSWYPAQAQAGLLPMEQVEKMIALDANIYGAYTNVAPQFKSHSLHNAAVAAGQTSHPVVIYFHGAESLRTDNSQRAEELASHGYIVAALAHTDCYAQVFPDGMEVFGNPRGDDVALLRSRLLDFQFFLDQLVLLNTSDELFAGTMDLDHVGAFGWSFGGGAAAEICRVDSRVKAAVLLDAYLNPATTLLQIGLQKPFLSVNSQVGDNLAYNTQIFNKATNDAYLCQIKGTEHPTLCNGAWVSYLTSTSRQAAVAINALTLSFFNKYLKNEDDHLLDNPSIVYTNVYNFRKK